MNKVILLLESETNRRKRIEELIHDTLDHVTIFTAKTIAEAYRILVERTIDIFIVNVVLDGSDATDTAGMRFVSRIREIPKYTLAPVIIISSLVDSGMFAYQELNCLGYLHKLFSDERMRELLRKASYFTTERGLDGTLFFRKNRILYPVKVKDIVFMERKNNITYIHLVDKTVLDIPYITYPSILNFSEGSCLLMCNRGVVVNINYVQAVDATNRFVVLKDDWGMLDIGVTHRKKVVAKFLDYGGSYFIKSKRV